MTVTFIGHGYVGLVTACVFADFGNKVWVIGHTPEKIDRLKKGDPIFYEPGLKELLEKNLRAKRIFFTLDYDKAVPESKIIFITVGTPTGNRGEADLTNVFDVSKKIAKNLKKGFTLITCKSTVPVGTNKKIEELINSKKIKKAEIAVASCPEFLREGTAISDTFNPDRIVIGSDNQRAIKLLLELHSPISGKRIITDLSSAELIKYTSNAMLATKISFANLISFYSEESGADVEKVLDAVGLDQRIGRMFLYPGIGFGGSCLPKDVRALVHTAGSLGVDAAFFEEVSKINFLARKQFLVKILANTNGKKLAVWGLSFKPNTDDIRDAPSIYLIRELLNKGFSLSVHDPAAIENVRKVFGNRLTYVDNPFQALKDAHALCVLTEWNEFKEVDFAKVKSLLKKPVIFDGRNIYDPKKMKALGFVYHSVGRG